MSLALDRTGDAAPRGAVALRVNGAPVTLEAEPRTHLADLLREELGFTGTHLGCEHGVCGACTVEIDGVPARACLAFAPACDGAEIRTIEGLDDDPVAAALRAAFTAEHALQCGFCTPGMIVSARDLVLRRPDADEAAVREAMAGNLCRCTGYRGITRAVLRVLAERRAEGAAAAPVALPPALPDPETPASRTPGPATSGPGSPIATPGAERAASRGSKSREGRAGTAPRPDAPPTPSTPAPADPSPDRLLGAAAIRQVLELPFPPDRVWEALGDPARVASCVPGLEVTEVRDDGSLSGTFRVRLGPIGARFAGKGTVLYDTARREIRVAGQGADGGGPSRVSGEAVLRLSGSPTGATRLEIEARHRLTGLLAQFSRGALVEGIAARLAADFARNLEARLSGRPGAPPAPAAAAPGPVRRLLRGLSGRLRRWFGAGRA